MHAYMSLNKVFNYTNVGLVGRIPVLLDLFIENCVNVHGTFFFRRNSMALQVASILGLRYRLGEKSPRPWS